MRCSHGNLLSKLHSLDQKNTVWFDNYQYHTQGGWLEILRGREGAIKDHFFKEMHEVKLNLVLPELMEGLKAKKPSL